MALNPTCSTRPINAPALAVEEWKGWWCDNPPFHTPVFILTNHPTDDRVAGRHDVPFH